MGRPTQIDGDWTVAGQAVCWVKPNGRLILAVVGWRWPRAGRMEKGVHSLSGDRNKTALARRADLLSV